MGDAAMEDMQQDQTGEITKEEFIQWYKQSEVAILKQVKDAYDRIDEDNDGRIDKNELKKILQTIDVGKSLSDEDATKEVESIMKEFGKIVDGEDEKSLPFDAFHSWYVNSEFFESECKKQEVRKAQSTTDGGGGGDGGSEPLNISFPKGGWQAVIPYLICFPLVITLY